MTPAGLLRARDDLARHAQAGDWPSIRAVGLGETRGGPGLVVCASDPRRALDEAYARGFLARELPLAMKTAATPWRTLTVPRRQLTQRSGLSLALGDLVGRRGCPLGRLGPLMTRGGQVLALSAGHVFGHEGEGVYCDNQEVGRVLRLARPGQGGATLDAAVIELRALPNSQRLPPPLRLAPGSVPPQCGESLFLARSQRSPGATVRSISTMARVKNGRSDHWLADQFVVEGRGFAVSGDSGCALIGADGRLRGMLIAGEGDLYVATPIDQLLLAFDLGDAVFPGAEPASSA